MAQTLEVVLVMSQGLPDWVSFAAVLLAGLVAGLLFGTSLEQLQLKALDASGWVVARQSIDAVFSRLMPWLWNTTLVLLFVAAYYNRGAARWLMNAAGAMLLLGIVLTLVFEVPINKQIAVWTPASVPANWAALRDRWVTFHFARTAAGMVAFVFALLGLMKG